MINPLLLRDGMTVPLWRAFATLKLLLDMSSPIVEAARLNVARSILGDLL